MPDIKTALYVMSIKPLENDALFKSKYKEISVFRQKKADRYLKPQDKYRSVGAEIILRYALLSNGISTDKLDFCYGENGKPYLKGNPLFFNISHSGEYVICAVSENEIGCDIEKISRADLKIAKKFFAESEYSDIISLSGDALQAEAFFRLWTLKESFLKAIGTGLKTPLNSFALDLNSGNFYFKDTEKNYFFKEFSELDGYKCSVCSEKDINDMKFVTVNLREEII